MLRTLTRSGKIADKIVLLLAEREIVTAEALHGFLVSRGTTCSLQAVYQELRNLVAEGIVFKFRTNYGLRLPWVLELRDKVDEICSSVLSKRYDKNLLPQPGESQVWEVNSIRSLLALRAHLGYALLGADKEQACCEYTPHFYGCLGSELDLRDFSTVLRENKARYFVACGSNSQLDRYFGERLKVVTEEITFGQFPLRQTSRQERSLFIAGPYVVEVFFAKHLKNKIFEFFESSGTLESKRHTLPETANWRGRIRIRIKHDIRASERFRRQFKAFFGIR